MARGPRKAKPKSRHYRCPRCRCPIPTGYLKCGTCGYDPASVDAFIREAKRMFPGSREL